MVCGTCGKEAREGKVKKGVFSCSKCLAAAKKNELEKVIKERYDKIGSMLQRAEQMIYTAQHDLFNLKEFLAEKGIKVQED